VCHVGGHKPVPRGKAVQPPHSGQRPRRRRCGQRRVGLAEGEDKPGDVRLPYVGEIAFAEVLDVAAQIGRVGAQRVGCAPALDGQVVQERLDGLLRRGQG
jgi:hypothetical protein